MSGVRDVHRKLECSVGSEGAVGHTRADIAVHVHSRQDAQPQAPWRPSVEGACMLHEDRHRSRGPTQAPHFKQWATELYGVSN